LDFAGGAGGDGKDLGGGHQVFTTVPKPAAPTYPAEYKNWYEFRMSVKGPERRAYHSSFVHNQRYTLILINTFTGSTSMEGVG
jgi:hypothetical protein